jgi:hypothetical protein
MNNNKQAQSGLTRRDFIRVGTAGATGMALTSLGGLPTRAFAASDGIGKLPRRRYGRTGLQISALVGAADWNADVIPLAVKPA